MANRDRTARKVRQVPTDLLASRVLTGTRVRADLTGHAALVVLTVSKGRPASVVQLDFQARRVRKDPPGHKVNPANAMEVTATVADMIRTVVRAKATIYTLERGKVTIHTIRSMMAGNMTMLL